MNGLVLDVTAVSNGFSNESDDNHAVINEGGRQR